MNLAAHEWPADFEGVMKLPGLGPYTAAAVAIAFQWPQPALDGMLPRTASPEHQATQKKLLF